VVPVDKTKTNYNELAFDEDDFIEPKKKEKKEKKNLPIPYDPNDKVRLGKLKQYKKDNKAWDRAESLFGERAAEIMQLVEDNDRDGAVTMIYKQLMKMLVDVIPVIEKGVRATKGFRGVRSLNEIVSQVREMLADMQAVQDKGMLGQTLITRYVRPAFLDIAMQMMTNNEHMLNEITEYIDPKHRDEVRIRMKAAQRELGKYIQAQYTQIADSIVRGLT
jgi:hypothetical protein